MSTNQNTEGVVDEAQLRAAAEAVDREAGFLGESTESQTGSSGAPVNTNPDGEKKAAESQSRTGTEEAQAGKEAGTEKAGETKQDDPPKPGGEQPPKPGEETRFQKAKKDAERLDKSWKALEAEKQRIREEQEAVAREKVELAKAKQPKAVEVDHRDPLPNFTAEQLEAEADRFEKENQPELALQARKVAALKVRLAREAEAKRVQSGDQEHQTRFMQEWDKHRSDVVKAEPDLAKADHPVVQEVNKMLHGDWGRYFLSQSDGIKAAVAVAKLRVQASSVPALEQKIAALEKENQELKKATSISGAPPASKVPTKSDDPTEADLRRLAAEHDSMQTVA